MTLPEAVRALLRRPVVPGRPSQGFPFLTVDEGGFPHAALLSAVELQPGASGSLCVALAGPTTAGNVRRTGQAALLAVGGTTMHTLKLRVRRSVEAPPLLGLVLHVVSHKADSLDLALSPISYQATPELADEENWDRSRALLQHLAQI